MAKREQSSAIEKDVEICLKISDAAFLRDVESIINGNNQSAEITDSLTSDLLLFDVSEFLNNLSWLDRSEGERTHSSTILFCSDDDWNSVHDHIHHADEIIPLPADEKQLTTRLRFLISKAVQSTPSFDEITDPKWKEMVEKSADLVQISIDGIIQYINQAGAEIYGYSDPAELIGEFVRHEDDDMTMEELKERIEEAQGGGKVSPRILGIMHTKGERRFIKAQSVPFRFNGKRAVHTVGQDVTGLITSQRDLKKVVAEKEALLQEVHHRVKNNLAIISGLIELQAVNIDDLETLSKLKATQLRILSISKVHELLYQQEHIHEICSEKYLRDLTDTISNSFSGDDDELEFSLELAPFSLSLDQAIPCGLLINELISNSLKHAFPNEKNKKISIKTEVNGDSVTIFYRDFGVGLPDGVDLNEAGNFGMMIIDTLLKQLEADWEYKSHQGFRFKFSFARGEYVGPISRGTE